MFLRERESTHVSGGGEEREKEREKESQAGSTLTTKPYTGLINPMNPEIMTSAEIKSQTLYRLGHPGAPYLYLIGERKGVPNTRGAKGAPKQTKTKSELSCW